MFALVSSEWVCPFRCGLTQRVGRPGPDKGTARQQADEGNLARSSLVSLVPAVDPAVGQMLYSGLTVSRISCSRARTSSLVQLGIKTKTKVKEEKPYLAKALTMAIPLSFKSK